MFWLRNKKNRGVRAAEKKKRKKVVSDVRPDSDWPFYFPNCLKINFRDSEKPVKKGNKFLHIDGGIIFFRKCIIESNSRKIVCHKLNNNV